MPSERHIREIVHTKFGKKISKDVVKKLVEITDTEEIKEILRIAAQQTNVCKRKTIMVQDYNSALKILNKDLNLELPKTVTVRKKKKDTLPLTITVRKKGKEKDMTKETLAFMEKHNLNTTSDVFDFLDTHKVDADTEIALLRQVTDMKFLHNK